MSASLDSIKDSWGLNTRFSRRDRDCIQKMTQEKEVGCTKAASCPVERNGGTGWAAVWKPTHTHVLSFSAGGRRWLRMPRLTMGILDVLASWLPSLLPPSFLPLSPLSPHSSQFMFENSDFRWLGIYSVHRTRRALGPWCKYQLCHCGVTLTSLDFCWVRSLWPCLWRILYCYPCMRKVLTRNNTYLSPVSNEKH